MKHTQFLSTELSLYKEARRRHTTLESTQAILPERMTEAREVTAMDCVYKNPNEGVEDRIQDLLQRMTAEEKIGQMTQIHRAVSSAAVIKDFFIGKFLNHQIKQLNILDYETGLSRCLHRSSGSVCNSAGKSGNKDVLSEDWAEMIDGFQTAALETRLAIPIIYGLDAVHGNNKFYGTTIYPHNIGLGATRFVLNHRQF